MTSIPVARDIQVLQIEDGGQETFGDHSQVKDMVEQKDDEQVEIGDGHDTKHPAGIEMFQRNAAFFYFFLEQQGGDQEPADDEKDLYADDAIEQMIDGGILGDMVEQDDDDE